MKQLLFLYCIYILINGNWSKIYAQIQIEDDSMTWEFKSIPVPVKDNFYKKKRNKYILVDPGYRIWGLTVIKWGEKYHGYYSRWPERLGHNAWLTDCEIVHAVSDYSEGPFIFENVKRQLPRNKLKHLKVKIKSCVIGAITGFKSQNETILKPHKAAILEAINDSYAPVSVTASVIAYASFQNSHAEQKLKSYCKANNEYLALMALNHLLYVPNKTPFIATITELAKNDKLPYNLKAASLDILGSLN
ncbi:glycoside hydrolase family protein [Snuella sedimenti]|uniref:Uncharacterized protein n=1 Tax=Snuella sedimenti TaxID=2798802 RepID=A0A8J7LZ43_9FLAO|nr:hypothetical protein [Snuella sedimenti]MBJ6369596.1 hypothetical protein [Snuella sedimenti]